MVLKGDVIFYARIMPTVGLFDVLDLTVRTVYDTWFVAIDKRDKHSYLFGFNALGKCLFTDRAEAVRLATAAEEKCKKEFKETYYEEF